MFTLCNLTVTSSRGGGGGGKTKAYDNAPFEKTNAKILEEGLFKQVG